MSHTSKIVRSDIKYQDDKVTILHPHVKKGVVVISFYTTPENMIDLKLTGLKTGQQLQKEGIEFGRCIYHPYIFFRAPFKNSLICDAKKNTFEEIHSYYLDEFNIDFRGLDKKYVGIRVDPNNTKVYSSEIRATCLPHDKKIKTEIPKSEKTLAAYLSIIEQNKVVTIDIKPTEKIVYNLLTSYAYKRPVNYEARYPFNEYPIERNSEILVQLPHLTPDFFVDV